MRKHDETSRRIEKDREEKKEREKKGGKRPIRHRRRRSSMLFLPMNGLHYSWISKWGLV